MTNRVPLNNNLILLMFNQASPTVPLSRCPHFRRYLLDLKTNMLVLRSSQSKAMVENPSGDQGKTDGGPPPPRGDYGKDTLKNIVLVVVCGLEGNREGEPPHQDV